MTPSSVTAFVRVDSAGNDAKSSVRMINGDRIVSSHAHVRMAESVIRRGDACAPMDGVESSV